jgi:hypothetical protein
MAWPTLDALTPSDFSNGIPQKWMDYLLYDATRLSITAKFEGPEGGNSAIIRQDDPGKGAGDTFHFQTLSRLRGKGTASTLQLIGREEKLNLGQFDVNVAAVRHAVAYLKQTQLLSLYKPAEFARPQLAEWYARKAMDDGLYQKALLSTEYPITTYAGGVSDVSELITDAGAYYTFSVNELKNGHTLLQSMGTAPIETVMDNLVPQPYYGCFVDGFDVANLKLDPLFLQLNEWTGPRDETNDLRTGCVGMIDGMYVYKVWSIRGQGSPLRPEAKVYGVHTAIGTTITVGVPLLDSNSVAIVDYLEYFPDSGTISIIGDNGKVEYITYTSKNSYQFLGCTRGVTYGDKTSTAAAYTGGVNNREFITVGHFESNVIFFGAQSFMRAFAQTQHYIEQKWDYENEIGIGIESTHGMKPVKNSSGVNKAYCVMKTCGLPNGVKIA